MPVKEHVTHQEVRLALEAEITTDTTTVGAIFDTRNYDMGIYFALGVTTYTDGTYTLKIEDGDDSGLSDAADVATNQLVYGTLPALSAVVADGAMYPREGVHSTKRYVRASVVSTATTSGAFATVLCIKDAEFLPTSQT